MQRRQFLSRSLATTAALGAPFAPFVHAQGTLVPLKFTLD
ncbi:ABC transporter permease, partial [Paracidovorax avenae]